ncbi:hypothetical protein D3C81_1661580 [compost metagenome]
MKLLQHIVHNAKIRLQQPHPYHGRSGQWNNDRQIEYSAKKSSAHNFLVQQYRSKKGNDDAQRHTDKNIIKRGFDRRIKEGVGTCKQCLIVADPNPFRHHSYTIAGEAEIYACGDRNQHKQQESRQNWRSKQQSVTKLLGSMPISARTPGRLKGLLHIGCRIKGRHHSAL